VLVSEVMLQQTRVEAVVPYFERWMRRFPDVRSLAAADVDEVLKLWQGLGYYRRALRLHDAARWLVAERDGVFPASRDGLRSLPGVGPYTSAAVAALAFGEDQLAVDGNVRRVAARLLGRAGLPADREVERVLAALLGGGNGREQGRNVPRPPVAEALIELGALVCTPRAPSCDACPLRSGCYAAAQGTPEAFPAPRARRKAPRRRRYALVALDGDRVWLRRRGEDEMLGGLWGFPQTADPPPGAHCLAGVRHSYSHFHLELVPALVEPQHPALRDAAGATPQLVADLPDLALSGVDLRVIARLREEGLLRASAVS
jgi:A/G-specific adenine glycosylase